MSRNNSDNKNNNPNYRPTKAMDSKKEVANSNDPKIDQDFNNFPHHPSKESDMGKRSGNYEVDRKLQDENTNLNQTGVSHRFMPQKDDNPRDDQRTPRSDDNLRTGNSRNEEIGAPHNVSNEDLSTGRSNLPGTDFTDEMLDEDNMETNY